MTQQLELELLSPALLEKLAAASSVEEVKAVLLATTMEKPEETEAPEAPAKKAYREIWEGLIAMEDEVIGIQDAAEEYHISINTVGAWVRRERVRVVKRAMGRGNQVQVKKRDIAAIVKFNKEYRDDSDGKGGLVAGWLPKGKRRRRKSEIESE